jgi:general secretion pathway protein F/type IV pilus assembly protein PilC
MPLFRYRALSAEGRTIKGIIDADSLLVAKERLRRQQLLVTDVALHASAQKTLQLSAHFLLTFTQELAHLLRAGLPLFESLLTIEEKYLRHKAHPLLLDLCDHLREGHSLSMALKRYPKVFNQIYLAMVQVAEQTGNLTEVFYQLAQLIERQQKLKKQILSAISYPCLLGIFCILVSLGLFLFVIPSMKELFEGRALHPMTRCVIGISDWLHLYGTLLSYSLGLCVAVGFFFWKRLNVKWHFYRLCAKLPLLKTLLLQSSLVRLCRGLAMLLAAGVPLFESLNLVKTVVKNPLVETGIAEVEKKIVRGERLSHALKETPYFPQLVIRLISLSEETGKMQEAFAHLSAIYEEEVEKHLSQFTQFLQPVLLITLGMIVGLVVLSILLPLTDVSSFLST